MRVQKKFIFMCLLLFFSSTLSAQRSEMLVSFEEEVEWQMFGNAKASSKFYSSIEKGPDSVSKFVGKIEYSFLTPANDYLEITAPLKPLIAGTVQKIKLWINGDKQGCILKVLLKDAKDETFVYPLPKIEWFGWKQVEVDFKFSESYGGDNNGAIDGDMTFYGFLLEDDPNDQVTSGAILINDLELIYSETGKAEIISSPAVPEKAAVDEAARKGIFFSGLASMTFDDVDTRGSTNINQYKEPYIRQSLLHQYFDLNIDGYLYDKASVHATIRVEKGDLGWTPDRKEDYYNTEYSRSGFELEKMEVKGDVLGMKNNITIGKINPQFNSYSLSKYLYGLQWDLETGGFKQTIVGARPESTVNDASGGYTDDSQYNVYLMGIREAYTVDKLTFAGSLVNVHQNNGMFSTPDNFLRGNREQTAALLLLKMEDNSPEDDFGGNLFAFTFYENDSHKYSFDYRDYATKEEAYNAETKYRYELNHGTQGYDTGIPDSADYRYTKYDTYVIYGLPLTVDAESVEIELEAANNYKFELSIDGLTWYTVLVSAKDVDDNSNQGIVKIRINKDGSIDSDNGSGYKSTGNSINLEDALFVATGKTILSFDINGSILKTDVNFSYNSLIQHRLYADGKRKDVNLGHAAYLKLARSFDWLHLNGQIFDIMPKYDTSFRTINTVDDNDDHDEWPDHWQDETVRFVDENKNGIPDNEERPPYRQVGIYVIDDYFDKIEDDDHNDVRDDQQDDDLPDYLYKINQFGYRVETTIKKIRNLDFILGYKEIKAKQGKGQDKVIKVGIEYERRIRPLGNLLAYNETRKIDDTIPDDLVNYMDNLNYRNNLLNTTALYLQYILPYEIESKSKLQYVINRSLSAEETIQNAEGTVKFSRAIPLFWEFQLIPTLFTRYNKDVSKVLFHPVVYQRQIDRNIFDGRGILELAYPLSKTSRVFTAGQYGYYENLLITLYKYWLTTWVIGAQGSDIGSFQYGVEYKREIFDYVSKDISDGWVSSLYAHVSYRF